jgi:xanthine dehydrogenase FAD-binding subunit
VCSNDREEEIAPMNWHRPRTLEEAIDIVGATHSIVVSGGTDLFVDWPHRRTLYGDRDWLQINHLADLHRIAVTDDGLEIGAAVTASELQVDPLTARLPALRQAAHILGGWQVQNRASIAGNIVTASPAANFITTLAALETTLHVQSPRGARAITIDDFVQGPGKTGLAEDELVIHVLIPASAMDAAQVFRRFDQRAGNNVALVSVATAAQRSAGLITRARVVVGAAHAIPLSLPEIDSMLLGHPTRAQVDTVARAYGSRCAPITDVRATEAYRRSLVKTLVERLLCESLGLEE